MLPIDIRAIAAQARPYVPTRTVVHERLDPQEVFDILDAAGYRPLWAKGGGVIRFTPPVEWRIDLKHKDNWWIDLESGKMFTNTGSVPSLTDEAAKYHGRLARPFLEDLAGGTLQTHFISTKQVPHGPPESAVQALVEPKGEAQLEWHPFTADSAGSSNWVERLLFELSAERVADPVKWRLGWTDFGIDPIIAAGRYCAALANKAQFDSTAEHLKNSEFKELSHQFAEDIARSFRLGQTSERELLKLAMAGGRNNAFHVVQPAFDPRDGKVLSCFFWNPFYKAETAFFENALLVEADVPDWTPEMHYFMVRKRIAKRHNKYKVLSDARSRLPKAKCVFSWPEHIQYEGQLVWLVEGVYDAISLIEAGIPAVSTWTCQLQQEQVAFIIDRLNPKGLVLAFDDDPSGEKGVAKATELASRLANLWRFELYTGHTGVKFLNAKDAADTLQKITAEVGNPGEARALMKQYISNTLRRIQQ